MRSLPVNPIRYSDLLEAFDAGYEARSREEVASARITELPQKVTSPPWIYLLLLAAGGFLQGWLIGSGGL